jgi:hypothetical protein
MELAEQAHSRALTSAEVRQVMSNELTAYVYLEAALRQRAGVEYRGPEMAPKGCLVAPMYALLKKKPGGLTAEELTDVATRFPFHAWYAFKLGFGSEAKSSIRARGGLFHRFATGRLQPTWMPSRASRLA